MLRLSNVTKNYKVAGGEIEVLKGLNIAFRKNEFVSILGPSGCGKTTTLNIVGGLDKYTSGDLIIAGKSTKNFTDRDWDVYRNQRIGFVFQSYNLIPHQTVLGNVELALTISGVSKEERVKRSIAALDKVGLQGEYYKRPNQLSGGQCQRVAIARALVNEPDILLADEPTGALDSKTSVQIMELIKEISKDKLVIMVTHNAEIAEQYSTRIVRLVDGEIVEDSAPFSVEDEIKEVEESKKAELELEQKAQTTTKKKKKATAKMSIWTAFRLSLRNLFTKRGRTVLTSIAGSIGIIGIALVLALSTGFSTYINKLQGDTLAVYPVSISESVVDLEEFDKLVQGTELEKFPKVKEVYTKTLFDSLTNMLKSNKLTEDYLQYVENYVDDKNADTGDDKWKYCIQESYGFSGGDFILSDITFNLTTDPNNSVSGIMTIDTLFDTLEGIYDAGIQNSQLNLSAGFVREYIPTVSEMPNNLELIKGQYDLLDGDWATEEDDLMLVVDQHNQVSDITLALLGIRSIDSFDSSTNKVVFGGNDTYTFAQIMEHEFYYLQNADKYVYNDYVQSYVTNIFREKTDLPSSVKTLKIKGILRLKQDVEQGVLDNGIVYTSAFSQRVLSDNINSDIVQQAKTNGSVNVMNAVTQNISAVNSRQLGGNELPNKLSIYSVGYQAKEQLKTYLDEWNEQHENEEDKVIYSDSTEMLFFALNSMVDAVKIVLVAFTSISLVVSSIMIGIITYVSVVERTKEIGVLRSLGARKKDVSRMFNAETFIIGLLSGLLGVAITYLLSIPINLVIGGLIANIGSIAILKLTDALVLITVSFILTLIAGLIPARAAAKKDPVVALRTE
ncbi:MAG: ABC transporter ATP-binding protein/permease [Clostridia bacterium]|nr:ABC transporter ATP-binding protein/permease [Clostridia bacterium]